MTPVRTTHAGSEIHNRLHRNRGEGRSCGSNLHPVHNVRNELGLSDGYAEALGELIGAQGAEPPGSSCGMAVVTHSRRLAEGIRTGLRAEPSVLSMSESPICLDDWLRMEERRSVADLDALESRGIERFRAIHRLYGI